MCPRILVMQKIHLSFKVFLPLPFSFSLAVHGKSGLEKNEGKPNICIYGVRIDNYFYSM